MGGKRSGVSRLRRTLPKTFTTGGLSRLDRRGAEPRRVIEGAQQILEDKGGKDLAGLLMQRAAYRVMSLDGLLARDELTLAQGGDIDRAAYIAAATVWLRYAQAIGLDRKARRVPSLAEYAASIQPSVPAKSAVPVQHDADKPAPGAGS